jgi:hypothetical protein
MVSGSYGGEGMLVSSWGVGVQVSRCMEAIELVRSRWYMWCSVDRDGWLLPSPLRVTMVFCCAKEMDGIVKSASILPNVLSHSIPNTTYAPSTGKRYIGM